MDILALITDAIAAFGYVGIALLMLLENVIPPIPSEVIMPLAGIAVARGEMTLPAAIVAGSVGSILGALFWYYIGQALGLERICRLADRYGKWLGISSKEVRAVQRWFSSKGGFWAVGLGRLLPSIRTYISVPAGITRMPFLQFLLYTSLGSVVWITLLTLAGVWLGESYERISVILGPLGKFVSIALVAGLVGWLAYQWWQTRRSKTRTR